MFSKAFTFSKDIRNLASEMFPGQVEAALKEAPGAKTAPDKVIVAIKAERVISKTALAWALTHVVRPGDCITLLAVFSVEKTGRRFWNFHRWSGDCANAVQENLPDRVHEISESCSQMVLHFHNQVEVKVRVKVVTGTQGGAVAAEAKLKGVNWVVLDRKLKNEVKSCLEELSCNIVTMKGSQPKVLRLNLECWSEPQTPFFSANSSPVRKGQQNRMKQTASLASRPEEEPSASFRKSSKEGSKLVSSSNSVEEKVLSLPPTSVASNQKCVYWISQNHNLSEGKTLSKSKRRFLKFASTPKVPFSNPSSLEKSATFEDMRLNQSERKDYIVDSNIRDAVSLGRVSSAPPPLCSLCQHKAPAFGKPPRQFTLKELEEATDRFSDLNFLAEGGFGIVHRGILRDGQVVAVKQLKCGGLQADADFCREVRVLSCAQHRNVVLLIGFCIEDTMRLLVYEYICNGSLDFHLHGSRSQLNWHSRQKIAIGAARGLRYLHEDCRVGCIVHRDMRPHNILLTHDFEPMVADFGLARWHSKWSTSVEEQVIGTSGYLAPEYINGGMVSQKVDVYAFGMVLLELISGKRSCELHRLEGKQFISEWFHPISALQIQHLLASSNHLVDPCLASEQSPDFCYQLHSMVRAASLCLCPDPESRPSMSKILRVLEGGDPVVPLGLDFDPVGCRSAHLDGLTSHKPIEARRSHTRTLSQ
ncbi:inactive protein kinase SELMODRAFT_444075-like isoform X2 [Cucurbita pepo subsp. pepo]|uniref:inactive protein kinase SELMODRAFT_444075-like isoform X2 n=1 Tax=Cucurbita pepo subsp. pepo TaxID=3664 RepID=UPI000C9D823A|nr:inactive protein kinase SELMODRAFT_444075-like isoform X2 [Cucurbita pepo subsp. pepo]